MGEQPQPLAGARVVEVAGGIPAAFATRWMAGYGADVVRVEGVGSPPVLPLSDDEEVYLVAGKRRVRTDAAELRELCLAADIVVEDRRPGELASLGCAPVTLRADKPSLVITSITPFGQTGPWSQYKATNIVSFAMGGIMGLTGSIERSPLVTGGSQAEYLGGLNGFGASITAYFGTLLQGEGDWIDISMQECAASMLELYAPFTSYGEPIQQRLGNQTRPVWWIYPCADGYAGVFCLERQIRGLFTAMDDPELWEHRFLDAMSRLEPQQNEEMDGKVRVFMILKTKEELRDIARQYKVPIGIALTPGELLANEGLAERGAFDTVKLPDGRAAQVPGRPFLGLPWRATAEMHEPGADTAAVRAEWLGVKA